MQEVVIDPAKGALANVSHPVWHNGFWLAHGFSPCLLCEQYKAAG
jgi:hypothetical protein